MRRAFQIAGMGLSGLLVNWGRTILTMLGIVIGVAAVVLLASLGNGIQKSISGQINDLGPNLITISPGTGGEQDGGDNGPFGAAAASTLTPEDTKLVAGLPGGDQPQLACGFRVAAHASRGVPRLRRRTDCHDRRPAPPNRAPRASVLPSGPPPHPPG